MSLELLKDEVLSQVSGGGNVKDFAAGLFSPPVNFARNIDGALGNGTVERKKSRAKDAGEVVGSLAYTVAAVGVGMGFTAGVKKIASYLKEKNFSLESIKNLVKTKKA